MSLLAAQALAHADPSRPAGAGTLPAFSSNLQRLHQPNLGPTAQTRFLVGHSFFTDPWVTAPSSTTARDGLGPLFNARSCLACHAAGGRGERPEAGELPLSLVLRLGDAAGQPDPVYGRQLQPRGAGIAGEGRGWVEYETVTGHYPDGASYELRRPRYALRNPGYGPLAPATRLSPRQAPALYGLGLLEAVPEADILAQADAEDRDGDGISGRPHWHPDGSGGRALGRFGHKAVAPSLLVQTASAFQQDIGITSRLYPEEACGERQEDCRRAPSGRDPESGAEIDAELLTAVATVAGALGLVARRDAEATAAGEALFASIGCAACHTPRFVTGPHPLLPELAGQAIHPYSDLLLHDLGADLAAPISEGEATGSEWRTAPLWGLATTRRPQQAASYLHDGRARSIEEAILWHGGEAAGVRQRFMSLPAEQRRRLLGFLESL